MENIVIFTLNILILMFIWFIGFKPAIKARKRVDLMNLRKEVDKHFSLAKGKSTDSLHISLIGIIESTSRALDTVSLSSYLAWTKEVEKHQDFKKILSEEISKKFHTNDAKQAKFIEEVRNETSMIGLSYMVESSFFLLLSSFIYALFYFFSQIIKKGTIQLKNLKPDVEARAEKILDPDFILQKSFSLKAR